MHALRRLLGLLSPWPNTAEKGKIVHDPEISCYGWCGENSTLRLAALPPAPQKGRGLQSLTPDACSQGLVCSGQGSGNNIQGHSQAAWLFQGTCAQRWAYDELTPCHMPGSRGRVLLVLMGSLQGGFLSEKDCQEECTHARHRANYLCSRKQGWHRLLDSPGDPSASVPMPCPLSTILLQMDKRLY